MKAIATAVGVFERLVWWLCCPLAGVGLLCMIFLLAASSAGRLANLDGTADFQNYSALFFFGFVMLSLAPTLIADRHVRVDVLREKMAQRTQAIVEIAGLSLVLLPLCLVMTRIGLLTTVRSYVAGEPLFDLGSAGLKWLLVSFLPLGFVALLLAAIARMLRQILILIGAPGRETAVPFAEG